jgi:hypothetical protein
MSSSNSTVYMMVIETSDFLHRLEANQFNLFTQKLHNGISNLLNKFQGTVLKHNDNTYEVTFVTVTNAVLCGLKLKANFKYITPKFDKSIRDLKLGITEGKSSKSKVLATRMCEIVVKDKFVISEAIKIAYEKENRNNFINRDVIKILKSSEEQFLTQLMDYVESIWHDAGFNVSHFSKHLGLSWMLSLCKNFSFLVSMDNKLMFSICVNCVGREILIISDFPQVQTPVGAILKSL